MQVRTSYGSIESCCMCAGYEEGYNGGGDGFRCCGLCGHALTRHHVTFRGSFSNICDVCKGRGYEQFGDGLAFAVPLPCPKCQK